MVEWKLLNPTSYPLPHSKASTTATLTPLILSLRVAIAYKEDIHVKLKLNATSLRHKILEPLFSFRCTNNMPSKKEAVIDWSNKDSLESTFPAWKQGIYVV